jgi:hypothetical protein
MATQKEVEVAGMIDGTTPVGTDIFMADGGEYVVKCNRAMLVDMIGQGDAPNWRGTRQQWNETMAGQVVRVVKPGEMEVDADDALMLALARAYRQLGRAAEAHADADAKRKAAAEELKLAQADVNHAVMDLLSAETGGWGADAPLAKAAESGKPGPNAWRKLPLTGLKGVPATTLRALADAEPPILTLGELVKFEEDNGDTWAQKIRGLGPAGIKKIADATLRFWDDQKRASACEPEAEPALSQPPGA